MLGYARILNTTRGDLIENPLKVGELVQLRSGGRVMVVASIEEGDGEKMIGAMWQDKMGVDHNHLYPEEILQRAKRSFFSRRR